MESDGVSFLVSVFLNPESPPPRKNPVIISSRSVTLLDFLKTLMNSVTAELRQFWFSASRGALEVTLEPGRGLARVESV